MSLLDWIFLIAACSTALPIFGMMALLLIAPRAEEKHHVADVRNIERVVFSARCERACVNGDHAHSR